MKNSRKISMLLVFAIILTSLVIPIGSSATEQVLLNDNFDAYESVDELKAAWGVDTNSSTTITPDSIEAGAGEDNSMALQLNRTTGTDWIMKHFTTTIADEGSLKASLKLRNDYSVVDGAVQYFDTFIALGSKNNNGKYLPAIYIKDGILYTGANNRYTTQVCSLENGKWYDIEFIYDIVSKEIKISVSADGVECGNATLTVTVGVAQMTAVETMRIQMYGTENCGSLTIDDVDIIPYVESEDGGDKESTIYIDDSFNDYADIDALKAVWGVDTNSSTTITPDSIAMGTGADDSTALQLNRTTGTDWIMKHFTEGIYDEGKVQTSFKFKHDYNTVDGAVQYFDTFIALGSKNNNGKFLPALYINGGVLYAGANNRYTETVCNIESGKWYDVEFNYDIVSKKLEISVSADGVKCGSAALTVTVGVGSMTAIETMRIQMYGTENCGSMTIDDVVITDYVASEDPEVTESPDITDEPVVTEAPDEGDTLYIDENFNDYADIDELKAVWGVDTNSSTTITPDSIALGTGADNSTALQLNRTTGTDWIMKHFAKGISDEGAIKTSFKIKLDYNTVDGAVQYFDTFIALGSKNNNGKFLPALYINGGVLYAGANNRYTETVCNIESGKWYDVEFNYDIVSKKLEMSVSADGVKCGSAALTVTVGVGSMTAIETMRIQMYGTENCGSLTIDDVIIDDYVASDEGGDDKEDSTAVLLEDNYNSYKSVSELTAKWIPIANTAAAGTVSLGTGEDSTGAITMTRSASDDQVNAYFNETATAGEFITTFKMVNDYTDANGGTSAQQTSVISFVGATGTNQYIPVIYIQGGKIYTGTNNNYDSSRYICDSESGKWYDVEIVFDVDNMTYDVSLISESKVYKKENVQVSTFNGAASMVDANRLRLQMWGGASDGEHGKMTIDDVLVRYSTNAIDVKSTDLLFETAKGEKNYYASTLPASTSKITIDFGTVMNDASLSDSTVILKNETDNETVVYEGDTSGSIYTIPLPDMLKPSKSYSLTITTQVQNVAEENAAMEAVFNFKTDAGECEVGFASFAIGENTAPTVSDVLAAENATVKLNVLNSTGEDKDLLLIVAYFNEDELVDVIYKPYVMTYEDYSNGIFEQNIELKSGITADKVCVFAWDTISNMVPYTDSIEISNAAE